MTAGALQVRAITDHCLRSEPFCEHSLNTGEFNSWLGVFSVQWTELHYGKLVSSIRLSCVGDRIVIK